MHGETRDNDAGRHRGRRGVFAGLVAACAAAGAGGACLVDPDNPCGRYGRLSEDGVCVCAAGARPSGQGTGCQPCGPLEVETRYGCGCAPGYVRRGDTWECVETPALRTCDGTPGACPDAGFSHCYIEPGKTDGVCTLVGCAHNGDCRDGWVCDRGQARSFCREVSGHVAVCSSAADCAPYEASYCVEFSGTCQVAHCALDDPDACPSTWTCCDVTSIGGTLPPTLCLPAAYVHDFASLGVRCAQ
jgi:hypothetical protein